jgi:hypothetical protein
LAVVTIDSRIERRTLWLSVMNTLTIISLLASVLVCSGIDAPPQPKPASREQLADNARLSPQQRERLRQIRKEMDATVFPSVSYKALELREAIESLVRGSREYSPGRSGISCIVKLGEKAPPTVSLALRNATLPQVLDSVCSQTGYVWSVETTGITLAPAAAMGISKTP